MSTRTEAIKAELDALRSEIDTLDALTEPTDEQTTRFAAALDEWDSKKAAFDADNTRTAQLNAVRSASLDVTNVDRAVVNAESATVIKREKRDAFDASDAARAGTLAPSEFRSRALDAIESQASRMSHDSAEKVTRLVENDDNSRMAQHVLLTGSDEYHSAFRNLMKNQGEINSLDPEEQESVRAALSLTGANGGFLIPVTLDPTIILTNSGSANPFRQISQVKTITTNFWEGVTSAGVNAAWLAEGAVAADATPTVAQPVITPQKAAAWVFGSYEVLGDSDFAQQFPSLLVDAKDRLEEAAFATGAGSGGVPKGIVTAATTAVTTAAVATYAVADVYSLQAAIPPRFRTNAKNLAMVANVAIINKTRQFDTAGGSSYWTNLGAGAPPEVLGIPLYESTTMVGTTTTASKIAVAGDFSQYCIVDRVGMTVAYEPMVKDSATARPTGQAGWFAYWRVGADALVPGAFRTLTVQ